MVWEIAKMWNGETGMKFLRVLTVGFLCMEWRRMEKDEK